jgi:hypothetical protein
MSAKTIMSVAEKLYTQGYISYPRQVEGMTRVYIYVCIYGTGM